MVTKTALVGLTHFLMTTDPHTAQNVFNQLPLDQEAQIVFEIKKQHRILPNSFEEKLLRDQLGPKYDMLSSPTRETSSGGM